MDEGDDSGLLWTESIRFLHKCTNSTFSTKRDVHLQLADLRLQPSIQWYIFKSSILLEFIYQAKYK